MSNKCLNLKHPVIEELMKTYPEVFVVNIINKYLQDKEITEDSFNTALEIEITLRKLEKIKSQIKDTNLKIEKSKTILEVINKEDVDEYVMQDGDELVASNAAGVRLLIQNGIKEVFRYFAKKVTNGVETVVELFLAKDPVKGDFVQVGIGKEVNEEESLNTLTTRYSGTLVPEENNGTYVVQNASPLTFTFGKMRDIDLSRLKAQITEIFTSNNVAVEKIDFQPIVITKANIKKHQANLRNSSLFDDKNILGKTFILAEVTTEASNTQIFYIPAQAKKYPKENSTTKSIDKLLGLVSELNVLLPEGVSFGSKENITVTSAEGNKYERTGHELFIVLLKNNHSKYKIFDDLDFTNEELTSLISQVKEMLFEEVSSIDDYSEIEIMAETINFLGEESPANNIVVLEGSVSRKDLGKIVEGQLQGEFNIPLSEEVKKNFEGFHLVKKGKGKKAQSKYGNVLRTVFNFKAKYEGTTDRFKYYNVVIDYPTEVNPETGELVYINTPEIRLYLIDSRKAAQQEDISFSELVPDRKEDNSKVNFRSMGSKVKLDDKLNAEETAAQFVFELRNTKKYKSAQLQIELDNISKANASIPSKQRSRIAENGNLIRERVATSLYTGTNEHDLFVLLNDIKDNISEYFQNIDVVDTEHRPEKVLNQLETSVESISPTQLVLKNISDTKETTETDEDASPFIKEEDINEDADDINVDEFEGFGEKEEDFDEDDFMEFNSSTEVEFDLEEEKAIKYLQDKFYFLPKVSVKFMPFDVMQRKKGKNVYGLYKNGVFYLATKDGRISTKVLRHETFHLLFDKYIPNNIKAYLFKNLSKYRKYKEWLKSNSLQDNAINKEEFLSYQYQEINWESSNFKFNNKFLNTLYSAYKKIRSVIQQLYNMYINPDMDNYIKDFYKDINSGVYDTIVNKISGEVRFMKNIVKTFPAFNYKETLDNYKLTTTYIKNRLYDLFEQGSVESNKRNIINFNTKGRILGKSKIFSIQDGLIYIKKEAVGWFMKNKDAITYLKNKDVNGFVKKYKSTLGDKVVPYFYLVYMNKSAYASLASILFNEVSKKELERVKEEFLLQGASEEDAANLSAEITANNKVNNEIKLSSSLKRFLSLIKRTDKLYYQDNFIKFGKAYVRLLDILQTVDWSKGDIQTQLRNYSDNKGKVLAYGKDDNDIINKVLDIFTNAELLFSRIGGIRLSKQITYRGGVFKIYDKKKNVIYTSNNNDFETILEGVYKKYNEDPIFKRDLGYAFFYLEDYITKNEITNDINKKGYFLNYLNDIRLRDEALDKVAEIRYNMSQAKQRPFLTSKKVITNYDQESKTTEKQEEEYLMTGIGTNSLISAAKSQLEANIVRWLSTKSKDVIVKFLEKEKYTQADFSMLTGISSSRFPSEKNEKNRLLEEFTLAIKNNSHNIKKGITSKSYDSFINNSSSYFRNIAELTNKDSDYLSAQSYVDGSGNKRYLWIIKSFIYDAITPFLSGNYPFSMQGRNKKLFYKNNIFRFPSINKISDFIEINSIKQVGGNKAKFTQNFSGQDYFSVRFVAAFMSSLNFKTNNYWQLGIRESNRAQDRAIKAKRVTRSTKVLMDAVSKSIAMEDAIIRLRNIIREDKVYAAARKDVIINMDNGTDIATEAIKKFNSTIGKEFGMNAEQFFKAYDIKNMNQEITDTFFQKFKDPKTGQVSLNRIKKIFGFEAYESFQDFKEEWEASSKLNFLDKYANKLFKQLSKSEKEEYIKRYPNEKNIELFYAWEDFYINNYINGYHYDNIVFGNSLFTKNAEDHIKREQGTGSPGSPLMIGANHAPVNTNYTVYKDTERVKTLINDVQKIYEKIHGADYEITDAATFILPETVEELHRGTGDYTLGEVIKNVVFYIDPNSGAPVYVKTASFVITPELEARFPELREMAEQMRAVGSRHHIPTSAFKVGHPLHIVQNGERIKKSHLRQMKYQGYRIQSNPIHIKESEKQTNLSQFNYFLNVNDLNEEEAFAVYTADEKILKLKWNSFIEKNKIYNEDGTVNKDKLKQMLISNLSERDSKIINLLSSGVVDINYPAIINKLTIELASQVSKNSAEVKHTGNKLVVQPSLGIDFFISSTSVITYDTLSDEEKERADLFYKLDYTTREELKTIYSNFTIAPDTTYEFMYRTASVKGKQVLDLLKQGKQTQEMIPRKLRMRDENGYTEVIAPAWWLKDNNIKEGVHLYNELSKTGLAVRIPTTGIHSAIAIKIIASPSKINLIIAPEELVPLHGSDFDVDSLFYIRRENTLSASGKQLPIYRTKEEFDKFKEVNKKNRTLKDKLLIPEGITGLVGYDSDGKWDSELIADLELAAETATGSYKTYLNSILIKAYKNIKIDNYLAIVTANKNKEDMNTPIEMTAVKSDIFSKLLQGVNKSNIEKLLSKSNIPDKIKLQLPSLFKLEDGVIQYIGGNFLSDKSFDKKDKLISIIIDDVKIKNELLNSSIGVSSKLKIVSERVSLKSKRNIFNAMHNYFYHKDNFGGVSGTGIQANFMKAVAYMQYTTARTINGTRFTLNEVKSLVYMKDGKVKVVLNDGKVLQGNMTKEEVKLVNTEKHIDYGVTVDGKLHNTLVVNNVNGERTTEIGDTVLNGYIDNVKEQITSVINANGNTISTIASMIVLGIKLDTITYFMNQPIITYITSNPSGLTSKVAKLKAAKDFTSYSVNTSDLIDNLNYGISWNEFTSKATKEEMEFQYTVLNTFMRLRELAAQIENEASKINLLKSLPVFMKDLYSFKEMYEKEDNFNYNLLHSPNINNNFNALNTIINLIENSFTVYGSTIKEKVNKILDLYDIRRDSLYNNSGEVRELIVSELQSYLLNSIINNFPQYFKDGDYESFITNLIKELIETNQDNLFVRMFKFPLNREGKQRLEFSAGTNIDPDFEKDLQSAYIKLPKELKLKLMLYSVIIDGAKFGFKSYSLLMPPVESEKGAEDGIDYIAKQYSSTLTNFKEDRILSDFLPQFLNKYKKDLRSKGLKIKKEKDSDFILVDSSDLDADNQFVIFGNNVYKRAEDTSEGVKFIKEEFKAFDVYQYAPKSKKSLSNTVMSKTKLNNTLKILSKNTGIEYVTDEKQFEDALMKIGHTGIYPAGFVFNNKVYINTTGKGNQFSSDTALHEFSHIYIKYLKENNIDLYNQILRIAKKSNVFNTVKEMYPELKGEDLLEEVAATAIGLEGEKPYFVNKFFKQIKKLLNKLGIYKFNTLSDIANDLLTKDNSLEITNFIENTEKLESIINKLIEDNKVKLKC